MHKFIVDNCLKRCNSHDQLCMLTIHLHRLGSDKLPRRKAPADPPRRALFLPSGYHLLRVPFRQLALP